MDFLRRLFGGDTGDQIGPTEARDLQQAGAIIVDVREPDEWRSGHVPGAHHIPLRQLSARLDKLPKDRDLLFICQSGSRSRSATSIARQAGLASARNVGGGMIAWTRNRLPVTR